jgi:broad specificity phosphatase PhoE
MSEIILVRHGRSAHVQAGWIDLNGIRRWREAYEAAGIAASEASPRELRDLAARAGVVVTSNAARAIESGRLLAPGREITASPLLRELDLPPPQLRGLRLPLAGWALTYGFRWICNRVTARPDHSAEELARASQAAEWLAGLAEPSGTVVAVTHATFRRHVARELSARGWRLIPGRRRSHPWSAWRLTLTRPTG